MTNADAQKYFDARVPVWTRISGSKVQVRITAKVEIPGRPARGPYGSPTKKKTEWSIRRVDDPARPISNRNAAALHASRDFMGD